MKLVLGQRRGPQRAAGKLIGTDLYQPHLDGVTTHIDPRDAPGGRCPTPVSPPSPPAAVLRHIPLGQLFAPRARRRLSDDGGSAAEPKAA